MLPKNLVTWKLIKAARGEHCTGHQLCFGLTILKVPHVSTQNFLDDKNMNYKARVIRFP